MINRINITNCYKFLFFNSFIILLLLMMSCSSTETSSAETKEVLKSEQKLSSQPAATQKPTESKGKSMKQYDSAPPMAIDTDKEYTATIVLEKGGEIVIELYAKEAPVTVNSFVFLSKDGYYDGVTFHRVIPGFMAQGGDPTGSGAGGPGYTFDNEPSPIRRHDSPGMLSMANAGVRGGKGTNGSQFFITFVPTEFLDGYDAAGNKKDCSRESCHTVFGKVIEGMDVVSNITIRDPGTAREPGDAIETIKIEEK